MGPEEQVHVSVPLDEWVTTLVQHIMDVHVEKCPLRPRVERLEVRLMMFIALMVGSGVVGAIAGDLISLVLPGK